ncbi:TolC family protein [Methylogaea oryzae]|uniref:RND transporter n=2 Tax=Methylogaea oryzae TaxID=1295382 RepID=A0A8D5AJX1_9GAMM|nr:TolC family protein [Methylogaea oryzae]BBL70501.1 RND transporter [Methylogaea oryzae]
MSRSVRLSGGPAAAVLLSALWLPPPAAAEPPAPLALEAAVAEAVAGNPGLAEMRARAEAMAAVPSQEGSLPDPIVRFDAQNLPTNSGFNLRREDMTYLQAGFSQELPFPGKLALKEKAAEYEAAGAADSAEEARLRLVRDVKQLWWQLFYRERALEIVAATEKKLNQLADATLARYRVGEAMQQDALLAQLELSKLRDMELEHARLHHGEIARLNALLDRPAGRPLRLPPPGEPTLPQNAEQSELLELAERNRPALAQLQKALGAAQSRLELADKGYYPDFNVGADYAARQNTPAGLTRSDFANFHVSMNLPIYAGGKQAKAVDQRHSELLQEQYALQDALRKVQAEVAENWVGYGGARQQFQLVKTTILPQAKQTAAAMASAYQVGQADFANLLRAETAVLEYETRYWQAYVQAQQAWARLAAAVGKEGL